MDFQASVGSSLKPKTPGTIAPPCPDHLIALVLSRIGPTCNDVPHNKMLRDLEPIAYCELCWTKCPSDQLASNAEIDAWSWSGGLCPIPFVAAR
jgi:hypothetical protein